MIKWLIAVAIGVGSTAGPMPPPLQVSNVIPAETPQSASVHREMRQSFAASCRKGNQDTCYELGRLLRHGLGGQRDEASARRLFANACGHHVSAACRELDPTLIYVDMRKGDELGCRGGDQSFCYSLAGMLRDGVGGPPDLRRARLLFNTACRKGYRQACVLVGR